MSEDLKGRVVSGVTWNTLARFGTQLAQFVVSVILARLLTPADFGIVAMILVFTSFMGVLLDFGLGSAIVQRSKLTDIHLHSTFWLNWLIGVSLTCVSVLLAPFVAAFFDVDLLTQLVRVWSINFVIVTLSVVPTALLQRHMRFKQLAGIEVTATVLSGAMGIGFALVGLGVWSILLQNLAFNLFNLVLKWQVVNWRMRRVFDFQAVSELWGYTIYLFGFNFINYWARNVDNLLIGKVVGADALGQYNRAYSLMLLPISQIISVISSVMFSAMSSIQDDIERVRGMYLRAMSVITLISFPVMMGLLVTAEPFVLTVYGTKWRGMILTLQILSIVGMMQSLVNPVGWIYTSQGKTRTMFIWGIASAIVSITGIVMGVWLGSIEAVAILYGCAVAMLLYPGIAIPGRFLQMRFIDVMRAIGGALGAAIVMAVIVVLAARIFAQGWPSTPRLLLMVLCGVISYSGLVVLFRVNGLGDILDLLRSRLVKLR